MQQHTTVILFSNVLRTGQHEVHHHVVTVDQQPVIVTLRVKVWAGIRSMDGYDI